MTRIAVIGTASGATALQAAVLRKSVQTVAPGATVRIIATQAAAFALGDDGVVNVESALPEPFPPGALTEKDRLTIGLPFLADRLLEEFEVCIAVDPGLVAVSDLDGVAALVNDRGTLIAAAGRVTPHHTLTPAVAELRSGPKEATPRMVAVTRHSTRFLERWQQSVTQAVVDILQPSIAAVSAQFLAAACGDLEVTLDTHSLVLEWSGYAAIAAGRAAGPNPPFIVADRLFEWATSTRDENDPERAWDVSLHQLPDSRPIRPVLNMIEGCIDSIGDIAPETPFDTLAAEVRRAADPFALRWRPGDDRAYVEWLFEVNGAGCTRMAHLLCLNRESLFREFSGVAHDPGPFRDWITSVGRDRIGFDPFDQSFIPHPARAPAQPTSHPMADALSWRWNIIRNLIPGHADRVSRRGTQRFLGPDPVRGTLTEPRRRPGRPAPEPWGQRPRDLNLIGPFRSESGLGQASRATLNALRALEIPFHHVDTSDALPSRNSVDVGLSLRSHGQPGDVNLVHANADEMVNWADTVYRHRFGGRFNAAMWFWEPANLPDRSRAAFHIVDELWVASQYLADVFGRYGQVPVHVVGLAVDLPGQRTADRRSLGWDEEELVFLLVTDALSTMVRKNPIMALQAFVDAFAPDFDGVRFVLKVSNLHKYPVSEQAIRSFETRYPAITVIDDYLPHERVFDLMAAADVYVSLHAAEGFGLTLLESMALGTPVIATGFSGNMDFMTRENSWLIDYRLTSTSYVAGPYPQGAIWAEPRQEDAISVMREIRRNPSAITAKAATARRDAAIAASPIAFAERLRSQLDRVL